VDLGGEVDREDARGRNGAGREHGGEEEGKQERLFHLVRILFAKGLLPCRRSLGAAPFVAMKKLLAAILLALAAPSLARAGDVSMRVEAVPLGARSLQAAAAPMHFNMLAVHWRGSGEVLVRTRSLAGDWN